MENNLLKRINSGYDGLIKSTFISVTSSEAEIVISVMDTENDYKWINVKLSFNSIVEFKICQKFNYSIAVMSGGIKILSFNSVIYVDFSPYSDEIENIEDIRKSDFYFGAKSFNWEIVEE